MKLPRASKSNNGRHIGNLLSHWSPISLSWISLKCPSKGLKFTNNMQKHVFCKAGYIVPVTGKDVPWLMSRYNPNQPRPQDIFRFFAVNREPSHMRIETFIELKNIVNSCLSVNFGYCFSLSYNIFFIKWHCSWKNRSVRRLPAKVHLR